MLLGIAVQTLFCGSVWVAFINVVGNHCFSKVLSSLLVVFQCCCGAQLKHGFVVDLGWCSNGVRNSSLSKFFELVVGYCFNVVGNRRLIKLVCECVFVFAV